jgi:hypothetical protein
MLRAGSLDEQNFESCADSEIDHSLNFTPRGGSSESLL